MRKNSHCKSPHGRLCPPMELLPTSTSKSSYRPCRQPQRTARCENPARLQDQQQYNGVFFFWFLHNEVAYCPVVSTSINPHHRVYFFWDRQKGRITDFNQPDILLLFSETLRLLFIPCFPSRVNGTCTNANAHAAQKHCHLHDTR